jgi:KDO2-lipid IV(A) lauroyltransferase
VPREADDVTSATILNDALADLIREFPGQFLWNYKRFRTQPEGAPRFY